MIENEGVFLRLNMTSTSLTWSDKKNYNAVVMEEEELKPQVHIVLGPIIAFVVIDAHVEDKVIDSRPQQQ